MLWQDEGIVLTARRHGESSLVVSLLTAAHGRHAGLVQGGAGRRALPLYQPGNRLQVTWRARLAEHLGRLTAEPIALRAAELMVDAHRLAGLAAASALLDATLPERDPHPHIFNMLNNLVDVMVRSDDWPEHYVRFELTLLAELGFGLDLRACAVTGATQDLVYVSPASGRAVTAAGAGRHAPRLLPLPPFLIGGDAADATQILAGLRLTGAFLRRHLFDATDRPVPGARERLVARLSRRLQSGGGGAHEPAGAP